MDVRKINLHNFRFSDPTHPFGSYKFARYIENCGTKILCQDGHRFYKNSESTSAFNGNQKVYWRCAAYKRYTCRARATTQMIGGSYIFFTILTEIFKKSCKLITRISFCLLQVMKWSNSKPNTYIHPNTLILLHEME